MVKKTKAEDAEETVATLEERPKPKESQALKEAIVTLNEKYGKGALRVGGIPPIEKISTGFWPLDALMGGGFPRARWSQLWGSQSVGKSTLCLWTAGKIQGQGGKVAYIDAEHALDPVYAKALGVDIDSLYYNRPESLEEAETYMKDLAPHMDAIFIDSVVAVSGEKELKGIDEKGMEKDSMMVIPQNLGKFFRVVTPIVGKSRCAAILVNQTRTSIGGYVSMDSYSGGNALKHALAMVINLRKGSRDECPKSKDGKTLFAKNIVAKIDKTKIGGAPEGRNTSFNIWFSQPYLRPELEVATAAIALGVIEKEEKTYKFEGKKIDVGYDATVEAMLKDPELMAKVIEKLKGVSI